MDTTKDLPEIMNFTASEIALGRQRCKKWVCLITQQVSLILKNKLVFSTCMTSVHVLLVI